MLLKTGVPAIDTSTAPFVLGSDECGYGSWAGPLCVGVVVVPRDWTPPKGLTDSKKMSHAAMRRVRDEFLAQPQWPAKGGRVWWRIQHVHSEDIDLLGVRRCLLASHEALTREAFAVAREMADGQEPIGIVDGNLSIENCFALPKADLLIPPVSMASVLAKLSHDAYMQEMDVRYPGYGFANHVGYGTPEHRTALKQLGLCALHRRSYAPIAAMLVPVEANPPSLWQSPDLEEEENPSTA